MTDDSLRAAIDAARDHTEGSPVHTHPRLGMETIPDPPTPSASPKPPTAQPTPAATPHPDARPAPHGGGIAPPDATAGYDVARIVDRLVSGELSPAGYRDRPAIVAKVTTRAGDTWR